MKDSIIPYTIVESLAQIENIYEMRLFGWVIAKAQSVLKLYNRNLKDINLQYALNLVRVTMPARYVLPDGDTNYNNIKQAFSLAKKTIPFTMMDYQGETNIIAFPEFTKKHGQKYITFVIHNAMWMALLDFSKGYRLVNLPTFMKLKSTYSVILYMLVTQQSKPMTYGIEKLKAITGANTRPAYARNYNFIRKVMDGAKSELDKVSQWSYDYKAIKQGKTITAIMLTPTYKADTQPPAMTQQMANHAEMMRCRLDERVSDYLQFNYGMTAKEVLIAERYLPATMTPEQQLTTLADIRTAALHNRAANIKAYLITSLRQRVG